MKNCYAEDIFKWSSKHIGEQEMFVVMFLKLWGNKQKILKTF